MSLEKLEEKLSSLSEETKSLYNKIDEKHRITINGKVSLELVDISNFKVLARGKNIQLHFPARLDQEAGKAFCHILLRQKAVHLRCRCPGDGFPRLEG